MHAATDAIDPQWYALHVHPQREYEVAYRLRRLGYSTFVPTELRTHKRASYAKGKTQFAVPLIPGCIFVGFPADPAWLFVLSDPRIAAPYGMDDKPFRMDFVKLFKFMNKSLDGCLVLGDGLRMVYVPGIGKVRSLNTRTKTVSDKRLKAEAKRPVKPKGRTADFLSRFVHGGIA
jgi:transcription antitermination factor NusG